MAEEHGFKAEVQQLLDLMIHSLYTDREIFVRELVSNAADALDRARFLALTRDDLVEPAHDQPGVRITVDPEAHTITIDDDGVGMTVDEVVEGLGTIAHSGSKAFLEALQEADDKPEIIGQFGVGFYSSFMVADEVVVETRSALPDAEPVRWVSDGEGSYTVDTGTREHRGTRITVHLRDDAQEFADPDRLRHIVKRYSNFLPAPIFVEGDQANQAKALWLEPAHQVSESDAHEFYKELSFDFREPALTIHVTVDSPIQYTALLFVPSERPWDLFQPEVERGPRLYARRVLITEHAEGLLPEWLRFLRGVVSSADISLNVSREMVQKTAIVQKIKSALTKRILKEFARLADEEAPEGGEAPYASFWRNFGVVLKEGYYKESGTLRERLLPLLRFNALSHDDDSGLISLADYRAAMPDDQDAIWYLTTPDRQTALASPHLEAFRKRGYDVLILTDAIDEWLVEALGEYEDLPLKSVARGELDLDDEAEDDEAEQADLSGLVPWLEGLYGDRVAGVRSSHRLVDSPCVLVDADEGVSSNMQRILELTQGSGQAPKAKRFLEINPRHALIRNLTALQDAGRTDVAAPIAELLLDDALLLEGAIDEPTAIGKRLQSLLAQAAASAVASGGDASGADA